MTENNDFKDRFIKKVWPQIQAYFNQYSQINYTKWVGPYIWNENGDIKRIITRYCENEYGFKIVHNESKIGKNYFNQFQEDLNNGIWDAFDPKKKRKIHFSVDIDITDATTWNNKDDFLTEKHSLFIEVKGLSNVFTWGETKRVKIPGFERDCEKLNILVDNGYCRQAIAILIDQGDKKQKNCIPDKNSMITILEQKYPSVSVLIWQKENEINKITIKTKTV